jgi:hypothetical protein
MKPLLADEDYLYERKFQVLPPYWNFLFTKVKRHWI